jgi:hypothetical protein
MWSESRILCLQALLDFRTVDKIWEWMIYTQEEEEDNVLFSFFFPLALIGFSLVIYLAAPNQMVC